MDGRGMDVMHGAEWMDEDRDVGRAAGSSWGDGAPESEACREVDVGNPGGAVWGRGVEKVAEA